MLVELGDFTFGQQANGDRHIIEELDGWFGSPDLRQSTQERPGVHGQLITESLYQGRAILLRGKTIPGPLRTGYEALQTLTSEMGPAAGTSAPMVVHEPASIGGPKLVVVRKAGRLRADASRHLVEWELPLLGQDPRKYSETTKQETITIPSGSTWSDVLVDNAGDFPSFPDLITISGTATGPIELERGDTGQKIVLQVNIATSQYVIYPKTRVVLYGPAGSETSHYDYVDGATRWWDITHEGLMGLILRRASTSGTLTAVIDYRDSWM